MNNYLCVWSWRQFDREEKWKYCTPFFSPHLLESFHIGCIFFQMVHLVVRVVRCAKGCRLKSRPNLLVVKVPLGKMLNPELASGQQRKWEIILSCLEKKKCLPKETQGCYHLAIVDVNFSLPIPIKTKQYNPPKKNSWWHLISITLLVRIPVDAISRQC